MPRWAPASGACVGLLRFGLRLDRGARVTRVPVYQWALPEDTAPLRDAIQAIARGEVDVALFTTSIQVIHLLQIAAEMNLEKELRARFNYKKPGETMIIIVPEPSSTASTSGSD